MRSALSALALFTALALPAVAHADGYDLFTTTGNGLSLTFTLPSSPTPDGKMKGEYFYLGDISFSENGMMITADDVYFFNKKNAAGGFDLTDANGNIIDGLSFYGPQLYTGGVKMPTFKEGDFNLKGGPACQIETDAIGADAVPSNCKYGLSIEPTGVAATPEPGSLLLLGTGALGALGMVRRRFLA